MHGVIIVLYMHKILLADDHEEFLKVHKILLERAGFHVIEARSGEEALHLAEKEKPNLVVLDVEMPKKDGISVMRDIRLSPWGTNMPIVLLTGKDEDDLRLKEVTRWEPAYYFLKAKASPNELVVKIQSLLS